jgi:hypothetical protein
MSNDTPAAKWRENNEADPHGNTYDCKRSELSLGDMTDDELANAVFLHGDTMPAVEDLIAGKAKPSIVYLTAAKDRIRWLSRQLEESLEMQERLKRVIGERDESLTTVKNGLSECLGMADEVDVYGTIHLERSEQVERLEGLL